MTDRNLPATDIPSFLLDGLDKMDYTSDDMRDTMEAFNTVGDLMPLNLMLGASGIVLATRLRLHDFGDAQTSRGFKIEEEKRNPLWLGTETMAIMERQAAQQGE